MNTADIFRNLIPCDNYHFPFVDRFSQFGVVFADGEGLGPGMLQVRSTAFTHQIAESALQLWFRTDNGELISVSSNRTCHLPWEVKQDAAIYNPDGSVLNITSHCVFASETRLACRFTFHNASSDPRKIRSSFQGQSAGDIYSPKPDVLRGFGYSELPARITVADTGPNEIVCQWLNQDVASDLPEPAIRITALSDLSPVISAKPLIGTPVDFAAKPKQPLFYAFEQAQILQSGEQKSYDFIIDLSVATYKHKKHCWPDLPESVDINDITAESKRQFEANCGVDDLFDNAEMDAALTRRIARSRWSLLRTGYKATGPAGEFGEKIASTCVPSCSGFTRMFFWDALFTSSAITEFNPEFARNVIETTFTRQQKDGTCPEHTFNYHVPARGCLSFPQAPIGTWAVERHLAAHPEDLVFLEKIYPTLVTNHQFWITYGDRDQDGLAEWIWSGQTADNSPLWDEFNAPGCNWLPPVASVQLNAFLYRDAVTLAAFAKQLDRTDDEQFYTRRSEEIFDAFMRICYAPDEHRFWDYNHATGRRTKIKTFYMFWPIWAGMPLDPKIVSELIEDVLLDPEQFYGDIPFPSVAYDEAAYDPDGYWRGRTWPHICIWLLEMLWDQGYCTAADEAANRLIYNWSREGAFSENMNSSSQIYRGGGQPDYNWGTAAFHLLSKRSYRTTNKRMSKKTVRK
jgi:hypothetical protein